MRSQNCEKGILASSYLSVRPFPTGQIFINFDICVFFENMSSKFKFHSNLTTITGTLHEDRYTFLIISRSVLLRMRNVSDKICMENQNTHLVFSDFSRKSCRLWDNVGKYCRTGQATDGNITWRMRIARPITKATNTHSEYVILIAFPLQQRLH